MATVYSAHTQTIRQYNMLYRKAWDAAVGDYGPETATYIAHYVAARHTNQHRDFASAALRQAVKRITAFIETYSGHDHSAIINAGGDCSCDPYGDAQMYIDAIASRCSECGGVNWLQDQQDGSILCMACCAGEKGVDW